MHINKVLKNNTRIYLSFKIVLKKTFNGSFTGKFGFGLPDLFHTIADSRRNSILISSTQFFDIAENSDNISNVSTKFEKDTSKKQIRNTQNFRHLNTEVTKNDVKQTNIKDIKNSGISLSLIKNVSKTPIFMQDYYLITGFLRFS